VSVISKTQIAANIATIRHRHNLSSKFIFLRAGRFPTAWRKEELSRILRESQWNQNCGDWKENALQDIRK